MAQQDSDLVIGVSVVLDRDRMGNTMSQGQLLILLTGDGTVITEKPFCQTTHFSEEYHSKIHLFF